MVASYKFCFGHGCTRYRTTIDLSSQDQLLSSLSRTGEHRASDLTDKFGPARGVLKHSFGLASYATRQVHRA